MKRSVVMRVIGWVRSSVSLLAEAPRQGDEGAPDAWLELEPEYLDGLKGISEGDSLIVLSWLHKAQRDVLQVHPRGDADAPLAGVFGTRSPQRPNPIGIHPVKVHSVEGNRLRIGPIEVIDGTPILDVKVAIKRIEKE
ncbi:MAG TPA: tRNA (N6-threonylcarbamoyladenosine(37)-N6)-methyltransferase TrmO [Bryobacteraceae bacterium]